MSIEDYRSCPIYDLRAKQPVSYGHEIVCTGCGDEVWIAVHHGRQDWCLTCQTIGPEAAIAFRDRVSSRAKPAVETWRSMGTHILAR